jgi:hypothetical protein
MVVSGWYYLCNVQTQFFFKEILLRKLDVVTADAGGAHGTCSRHGADIEPPCRPVDGYRSSTRRLPR